MVDSRPDCVPCVKKLLLRLAQFLLSHQEEKPLHCPWSGIKKGWMWGQRAFSTCKHKIQEKGLSDILQEEMDGLACYWDVFQQADVETFV